MDDFITCMRSVPSFRLLAGRARLPLDSEDLWALNVELVHVSLAHAIFGLPAAWRDRSLGYAQSELAHSHAKKSLHTHCFETKTIFLNANPYMCHEIYYSWSGDYPWCVATGVSNKETWPALRPLTTRLITRRISVNSSTWPSANYDPFAPIALVAACSLKNMTRYP